MCVRVHLCARVFRKNEEATSEGKRRDDERRQREDVGPGKDQWRDMNTEQGNQNERKKELLGSKRKCSVFRWRSS